MRLRLLRLNGPSASSTVSAAAEGLIAGNSTCQLFVRVSFVSGQALGLPFVRSTLLESPLAQPPVQSNLPDGDSWRAHAVEGGGEFELPADGSLVFAAYERAHFTTLTQR